jgi:hypothetical protein
MFFYRGIETTKHKHVTGVSIAFDYPAALMPRATLLAK